MPNRGDRGGSQTRARISAVATEMFRERGFDQVTIAEVAAAAGVSKVTVFAHFDRKEDLLLDRMPEALELVRGAIRGRRADVGAVEALRQGVLDLAERRHPLSGLNVGSAPMMQTLLDSPALIARLREFEHEIESVVAAELDTDASFHGDSALTAALLVAAYRVTALELARRRLAGDGVEEVAADHVKRVNAAFDAVARAAAPRA